jgi:hypothetical protein
LNIGEHHEQYLHYELAKLRPLWFTVYAVVNLSALGIVESVVLLVER